MRPAIAFSTLSVHNNIFILHPSYINRTHLASHHGSPQLRHRSFLPRYTKAKLGPIPVASSSAATVAIETMQESQAATAAGSILKKDRASSAALGVSLEGQSVVAGEGIDILRDLPANAFAREEEGSLIIGASSVGGATAMLDVALGKLAANRFLALGRTSLWWMTPAWGSTAADIPVETQFMLLELDQPGTFALLLPLINSIPNGKFRATLRSASTTTLGLRVESGASTVTADSFPSALLVAASRDPFELLERGVAGAAALSGTALHRSAKTTPPIADVFGWCTWDAFYSTVSASGIMGGLDSLVKGGVPPQFLIIDDGWQQTDVDIEYRTISHAGTRAAVSAAAGGVDSAVEGSGVGGGLLSNTATSSEEVENALHAVEEAAAELLAGPGDPAPEQIRGEHRLEEEEAAAAAAAAQKTSKKTVSPSEGIFSALWRVIAVAIARFEAAVLHLGKHLLDSSRSGSLVVRAFPALAAGPLRPTLLRFFAHSSDHCRRLTCIEANAKFASPDAGPTAQLSDPGSDLASVVSAIKTRFGVKFVYAWHAMGAFWGGIGVSDPEVAKYSPQLLQPKPTPGILEADPSVAWVQPVLAGVSLPLDPTSLHKDMHAYLASCGVDGVKVDVQGTIGLAGSGAEGGAALAAAYHASLEDSVQTHFPGNHLINCMCHSTEDLYNMTHTNMARVSDDFYPSRPASHTAHIGNCAYNSLFMGEITGCCDWDMFQSKHVQAQLHAAARAISGGPVYVSDRPGNHDFDLLRRLVFPDGGVLRCLLPGRPTVDCLFADVSRDGATVLKVWNTNAVNGVIGVFNVQGSTFSRAHRAFHTHDHSPPTLKTTVRATDVPTLHSDASFASLSGGKASEDNGHQALTVLYSDKLDTFDIVDAIDGGMELTVAANGGCDVVTVSAVASAGPVLFAPIGLTNMLNAGGAVMKSRLQSAAGEGRVEAHLSVRGSGSFLAYASHKPTRVMVGGEEEVKFTYDGAAAALRFALAETGTSAERECIICF